MHPKPKRISNPSYLSHLRTLPCEICGDWPTQAAHQRLLGGGIGVKPGDDKAIPLCYTCHMIGEHHRGVLTTWNERSGMTFRDKHDLREYLEVRCCDLYREFVGK